MMDRIIPLAPCATAFRQRLSCRMLALPLALFLTLGLVGGAFAQSGAAGTDAKKANNKKDSGKQSKKPKGPVVPKKDIMVFPTDTKEGPGEQVVGVITDVVKGRLAASDLYEPNTFSVSSPSFRRALSEQTLTLKDVKPPFDSNSRVQKLAQFVGYNYAVTSSLDDYQYDADKQQVSIVITVTLLDFTSGKPQPRPFGDSASTAVKGVKDAADTAPVIELVRNLTEKIMTELLKPVKPAAK